MKRAGIAWLAVLASACAPGAWRPPALTTLPPSLSAALERFAPIVVQETAAESLAARWDRPCALDPEGSGTLADDHRHHSAEPVPFYAMATEDAERLYLFYGLYYTMDWSGRAASPAIDHRGDFEGALVIVSRANQKVEAVITQAHKRFYLWRPGPDLEVMDDRPLLFSESGGHGLYAYLDRSWHAKGGSRYVDGMHRLPADTMRRLSVAPGNGDVAASLRPLVEIEPFVEGRAFKDLDDGATPPWFWRGGGAPTGAIVRDPAALYAALGG